jgi:hypothetical protein
MQPTRIALANLTKPCTNSLPTGVTHEFAKPVFGTETAWLRDLVRHHLLAQNLHSYARNLS